MRSLKYFIQQSWLLIVAAFCFGLLLALTNAALEERITRNEISALYDKMKNIIRRLIRKQNETTSKQI